MGKKRNERHEKRKLFEKPEKFTDDEKFILNQQQKLEARIQKDK